ncbi:MAG: ATP synthase F1 subunit delta [Holosporales bacterium]|nr:ATP synthase F1 subunit delta [Holosporales bacterium]
MDANSLKALCTSLPGRYAAALFREGKKINCLDEIIKNFQDMDIFFNKNPSIKKLLTSHCLDEKDMASGWISLGKYLSFCPVFLAFMRNVIRNGRFNIIKTITYIYDVAFAKYKNKRNVMVYSAVDLLPEQKTRLEEIIKKAFREKTSVFYKVSDKILGGIKISSEELVIDASASVQIQQVSDFMKKIRIKVAKDED